MEEQGWKEGVWKKGGGGKERKGGRMQGGKKEGMNELRKEGRKVGISTLYNNRTNSNLILAEDADSHKKRDFCVLFTSKAFINSKRILL